MGNPEHKKFINRLQLKKHPRESSINDDSKKINSDCFDEDDDLFREKLESKWRELFENTVTDNNDDD